MKKIFIRYWFLTLAMALFLFSCNSKSFDTKQELLDYLKDEENGYLQKKNVNGVDFSLMYRPTDLLVEQELTGNISKELVDSLRKKYEKYIYFNLSISKNNKALLSTIPDNRDDFAVLVNQLSFRMRDKVFLVTNSKDTIELVDYVYPRMFGLSKTTSLMFVYKRDELKVKNGYLNFIVKDLNLFTGDIKFKVPAKKINKKLTLSF